jgi:hypothetical protein
MKTLDEKTHSALCQIWSHLYISGNPDMRKTQPIVFRDEFNKKRNEIEVEELKDKIKKLESITVDIDITFTRNDIQEMNGSKDGLFDTWNYDVDGKKCNVKILIGDE